MKAVLVEHHRYRGTIRVGSHHVARELLERGHEVIWISHPRSWLHRVLGRQPPASVRHQDGVVELTPRVPLPYVNLPVLRSFAWGRRWLQGRSVDRLLDEAGADECDLFWLSDFTMLPLLDRIEARHVVLRFFDHLDQFRWMPRSIYDLARHYQERADLVIASSRDLVSRLSEEGFEAEYVPNGAHIREGAGELARTVPPSNRVVYVGTIDSHFDGEAVERWAAALPEYRFEIAGPNLAQLTSSLPNLSFLGPVSYERLPEWIAGARFGLIPFKVNALTRGVHPLKLYDYLSLGCPVLSAALPEVTPDPRGVLVYRSAAEGLELLRAHLDRDFDRKTLQKLALVNSWTERLKPVFESLGEPIEGAA